MEIPCYHLENNEKKSLIKMDYYWQQMLINLIYIGLSHIALFSSLANVVYL